MRKKTNTRGHTTAPFLTQSLAGEAACGDLLGRTAASMIAAVAIVFALCFTPMLAFAQEGTETANDGTTQAAIQAGSVNLLATQSDDATPQFHVQTAQVQGNNATTLASGPNFKHVPTTYIYDLSKDDYPVPYGGNGIPLANGLANYLQASGIFFPGDKLRILPSEDPNPGGHGRHELPGLTIANSNGELNSYAVGDRIGPLEVTAVATRGNIVTRSYIAELTVVDAPVMFSTGSGNGGGDGWATSNPDENGNPQDHWPSGTIRYVELPKYHPVEYRYLCNGTEIPTADLAKAEFYDNKPANPEVIWAEDLSVAFVPYVTRGTQWMDNKSGAEFTFARPFIEGYAFESMSIGTNGDNFWAWEPKNNEDGQTYTTRFRYSGDMDYNWTFTNQKEGNEAAPIVVTFNYTRPSSYPATMTIDANGGTINGRAKWMYNFYSDIYYNGAFQKDEPPIPTRTGYAFDGWYKDAACTQIISPSLESDVDLQGGSMTASDMQRYVENYGFNVIYDQGAHHFTIYAKWVRNGAENPLTVAAAKATQTLTYSAAKAQSISAANAYSVASAEGAVTYAKVSGNAGITVASNGTVTVKKGLAAGSYPITVAVTADGNESYRDGTKNVSFTIVVNKAASSIKLAAQSKAYAAKALAYTGKVTRAGSSGKVTYKYFTDAKCTKAIAASKVKVARTYYVKATLAADANYKAVTSAAVKFTIAKAVNPVKVATKKASVTYSKSTNRTLLAKKYCTVSKAQGSVTYKKVSGNKGITVAKNGKITIKKGLKKGPYKVKIRVAAAGNSNYKSKSVTKTITITVN